MPGPLLALLLAAAPPMHRVAVYPLRHPDGRDAQAQALDRVLRNALETRVSLREAGPTEPFAGCDTEACLHVRAPAEADPRASEDAIVPAWTAFDHGAVVSAVARNGTTGGAFTVARSVQTEAELPEATAALAREIAERLELPGEGAVLHQNLDRPTFGVALKLGDAVNTAESGSFRVSNLNLRFDIEGDYLAAPEFWPFVDVSLVLARDAKGQRVQLVPLLLGAKYVFRHTKQLQPFAGMGLGLGFLSQSLDTDTSTRASFAVYGVGGVGWFFRPELGVVGEASLNLNGLEASGGAGVLFAVGVNLGAVVLF